MRSCPASASLGYVRVKYGYLQRERVRSAVNRTTHSIDVRSPSGAGGGKRAGATRSHDMRAAVPPEAAAPTSEGSCSGHVRGRALASHSYISPPSLRSSGSHKEATEEASLSEPEHEEPKERKGAMLETHVKIAAAHGSDECAAAPKARPASMMVKKAGRSMIVTGSFFADALKLNMYPKTLRSPCCPHVALMNASNTSNAR